MEKNVDVKDKDGNHYADVSLIKKEKPFHDEYFSLRSITDDDNCTVLLTLDELKQVRDMLIDAVNEIEGVDNDKILSEE